VLWSSTLLSVLVVVVVVVTGLCESVVMPTLEPFEMSLVEMFPTLDVDAELLDPATLVV
jgi:hypothetical protein